MVKQINDFLFQVHFFLKRSLAHEDMSHDFLFSLHPSWSLAHSIYSVHELSLGSTFKTKVTFENRGVCECIYVGMYVFIINESYLMTFYDHIES